MGECPRAPLGSHPRPAEAPPLPFCQTQRPRSRRGRKGSSVNHPRKRFGMGALLLQPPGTAAELFLYLIHWSGSHRFQNLPAPSLGPGREAGQGAPQPVSSGMRVLQASSALGLARHRRQGPVGSPGPRPRWTTRTAPTPTTETGQKGDPLPEPGRLPQCQSRARKGPQCPPAPPRSPALRPGGTPRSPEQGAPQPS